jgi:beta-glucosidase-like glycosyl hydrolase
MSGPAVSRAGTRAGTGAGTWRDPLRPAAERVADLLAQMTLGEKVAQLTSVWPGDEPRDGNVAPMQGDFHDPQGPFAELVRDGLGQLTRVFGTRPVPPADALRRLRDLQSQVVAASRFGIPAVAHEECLTGFAAWQATIFPTPRWSARWPRPSAPACGRSASTRAWRPCST